MKWRVFVPNLELLGVMEEDLESVEMICRVLGKNVHLDEDNRILYIQSPVLGKTIALDAAHGGGENYSRGVAGFVEGDGVLDIVLRLQKRLISAGARVVLTRHADESVSLAERRRLIEQTRPDLFLTVHTGANWNTAVRGVATYYSLHRFFRSRRLAIKIAHETARATGSPLRGAYFKWPGKAGDGYLSLFGAYPCPCVLVECGCHSFVMEERLLLTDDYRDRCSDGIFSGIVNYFGVIPVDETFAAEITDRVAMSKIQQSAIGFGLAQNTAQDTGLPYASPQPFISSEFANIILSRASEAEPIKYPVQTHDDAAGELKKAPASRTAGPAVGQIEQTKLTNSAASSTASVPQPPRSCQHREISKKMMAVEFKNPPGAPPTPGALFTKSSGANNERVVAASGGSGSGSGIIPDVTLSEMSRIAMLKNKKADPGVDKPVIRNR